MILCEDGIAVHIPQAEVVPVCLPGAALVGHAAFAHDGPGAEVVHIVPGFDAYSTPFSLFIHRIVSPQVSLLLAWRCQNTKIHLEK